MDEIDLSPGTRGFYYELAVGPIGLDKRTFPANKILALTKSEKYREPEVVEIKNRHGDTRDGVEAIWGNVVSTHARYIDARTAAKEYCTGPDGAELRRVCAEGRSPDTGFAAVVTMWDDDGHLNDDGARLYTRKYVIPAVKQFVDR